MEDLGSGGPSGYDCHMPGTNRLGTYRMICWTSCPQDLLDPVAGRLFILLGVGLPGTGYRVNSEPRISLGREPRHTLEGMGTIDLMSLEAG